MSTVYRSEAFENTTRSGGKINACMATQALSRVSFAENINERRKQCENTLNTWISLPAPVAISNERFDDVGNSSQTVFGVSLIWAIVCGVVVVVVAVVCGGGAIAAIHWRKQEGAGAVFGQGESDETEYDEAEGKATLPRLLGADKHTRMHQHVCKNGLP